MLMMLGNGGICRADAHDAGLLWLATATADAHDAGLVWRLTW